MQPPLVRGHGELPEGRHALKLHSNNYQLEEVGRGGRRRGEGGVGGGGRGEGGGEGLGRGERRDGRGGGGEGGEEERVDLK